MEPDGLSGMPMNSGHGDRTPGSCCAWIRVRWRGLPRSTVAESRSEVADPWFTCLPRLGTCETLLLRQETRVMARQRLSCSLPMTSS